MTTLRDDVETDGRRAKVRFGRDWRRDAERRDFTINALYATADGAVVDLVGGLADLEAARSASSARPRLRIREDYPAHPALLPLLRLVRRRPAGCRRAEGLRAAEGGSRPLSAERVWAELKKLLAAPDPSRALLWMRQAGVLTRILPESEKWGIDLIHPLAKAEAISAGRPIRCRGSKRRAAGCRANEDAGRAAETVIGGERATHPLGARCSIAPTMTESALARALYEGDRQAVMDRLRLALAAARAKAVADDKAMIEAGGYSRLMRFAEKWEKPAFPLKGGDLAALGFEPGPKLGAALKKLESEWITSGFSLDRATLLDRAKQLKP